MADDDLVAFLDESLKPVRIRGKWREDERYQRSFYVVAAVVVMQGDVAAMSAHVRLLAERSPRGLRYSTMTPARRMEILSAINSLGHWEALVVETERAVHIRNDRQQRGAVLATVLTQLSTRYGVGSVVVESRAHPSGSFAKLDRDDRLLLAWLRRTGRVKADFTLEHRTKAEVMLGLADLVAGARSDALCGIDWAPWSLIAHWTSVQKAAVGWTDPRSTGP